MTKRIVLVAITLVLITGAGLFAKRHLIGAGTLAATPCNSPSPLAKWPLPNSKTSILRRGVTQTFARSADGTTIDFFDFDFA